MFFEVGMQQDRCRLCNYKLNRKKTAEITYLEENKQRARYRLTYSDISN